MKYLYLLPLFLLLVYAQTSQAQRASAVQASLKEKTSTKAAKDFLDCARMVRVESPSADTYTSIKADTVNYGGEISMRLRGLPEKKSMMSHMTFGVEDLSRGEVMKCYLKVYTVSKQSDSRLSVYESSAGIDEKRTTWMSQPRHSQVIGTKVLAGASFYEFDVTEYVLDHLDDGKIHFCLQTDSKKPVEISSRESGLGSELIIETCDGPEPEVYGSVQKKEKYGMRVLPNPLNGKLTIELRGVPAGGFGDLMVMDEQGNILRQLPMSIRDGVVLRHSLDFGDLMPGIYWAVFRKGRVMVRDQFRLQPSQDPNKLLEVAMEQSRDDDRQ